MKVFDPRSIGTPVYSSLNALYSDYAKNNQGEEDEQKKKKNEKRLKEQKNQAVQLYNYLATWGLMRLKAEEYALNKDGVQKEGKQNAGKVDVLQAYFRCLEKLPGTPNNLFDYERKDGKWVPKKEKKRSLDTIKDLSAKEYLGLSGLALSVAQEFSFWAAAVYVDVKGEE